MFRLYFITLVLLMILGIRPCTVNITDEPSWIRHPSSHPDEYGVFFLRNTFQLTEIPEKLEVSVSADNRYKLYVNGKWVGLGPSRGDLDHWFFETYDLSPYLQRGSNIIAVELWNFGQHMPLAQISAGTAFYLQSSDRSFSHLNSGKGNWRIEKIDTYKPLPFGPMLEKWYYVCGPGDSLHFSGYPAGWKQKAFNDQRWQIARPIEDEKDVKWNLIPRKIPLLEMKKEKIISLDRTEGLSEFSMTGTELFDEPLRIPAHSQVSLLFDQEYLTVGYPVLNFSGGKSSTIKITYAESLYHDDLHKGNRDQIEGKKIIGYYDHFVADGRDKLEFIPLWWRTFRYIQLDIMTENEELLLNDLYNIYVAYPLEQKASFNADIPLVDEIMETGVRTLALCSGETFFDCPYYEQLQYIGDTRVQALIKMYITGDDRLVRNAIEQFSNSFIDEGLTLSRHPAHEPQIIPTFSMYWISMLYDYLMIRNDPEFVKQYLKGIHSVINYFIPYIDEKNMLGNMPWGDTVGGGLPEYWYFEDWSRGFPKGIPQGVYDNNSSVITLHLANTLDQASLICDHFGLSEKAAEYTALSEKLKSGTMEHCYDPAEGLIAQTPDKKLFSQHSNILGILCNAIPPEQQSTLMEKILDEPELIQVSMYFRFYLYEALKKVGRAGEYPERIDFWYDALEKGMTTFPEKERNTRSDCHAWNASPIYHFLSIVAGIEPAEPGFKSLVIKPAFGNLTHIQARMPHPDGMISVDLKKNMRGEITGTILLPEGISGELILGDAIIELDKSKTELKTVSAF